MRKGKLASQAAHASMKVILDRMTNDPVSGNKTLYLEKDSALEDWINGIFTKICVYVKSEEELLELYDRAKNAVLPCALITDIGLTEFNNVPTNTAVAIGPCWSDEIDKITGHLPLL